MERYDDITFPVEWDDINKGVPGDASRCAIVRAYRREFCVEKDVIVEVVGSSLTVIEIDNTQEKPEQVFSEYGLAIAGYDEETEIVKAINELVEWQKQFDKIRLAKLRPITVALYCLEV